VGWCVVDDHPDVARWARRPDLFQEGDKVDGCLSVVKAVVQLGLNPSVV